MALQLMTPEYKVLFSRRLISVIYLYMVSSEAAMSCWVRVQVGSIVSTSRAISGEVIVKKVGVSGRGQRSSGPEPAVNMRGSESFQRAKKKKRKKKKQQLTYRLWSLHTEPQ